MKYSSEMSSPVSTSIISIIISSLTLLADSSQLNNAFLNAYAFKITSFVHEVVCFLGLILNEGASESKKSTRSSEIEHSVVFFM